MVPDPQGGGPRAELDLQDGSVTVEASGSGFIVTYGTQSWTWSGGNTFYITSAGVQTGNTFTLKSGIINVYMDSLDINSIGSAINVLGGTLNLYVANGMGVAASAAGGNADNGNAGSGASDSGTGTLSTLTSTSAPAIGVRAGASLFLTADAGQTLHLNSGASPAIGGTGDNSAGNSSAGNSGAGNNISGNGAHQMPVMSRSQTMALIWCSMPEAVQQRRSLQSSIRI